MTPGVVCFSLVAASVAVSEALRKFW